MDIIQEAVRIARDSWHSRWICPLLLLADAALCVLIVWKIPYTEIDWTTYMQHITQYLSGERDYAKLTGSTGPLVYPAVHVYIYRLLFAATDEGRDIKLAQYIFVVLYLTTLGLVMQCYRMARVPPYVFPLLILSKRMHSIFLLRLFNDGFAVFFLFLAIYCYQRRSWTLGSIAYSLGLGVKMSLLLAIPAIGIVLWQGMTRDRALRQAVLMGQIQILLGYPFIAVSARSYLTRAFEFSRQFMFKWTVNWRFVGEDAFLSAPFSIALLAAHFVILIAFMTQRWLQASALDAIQQLLHPPSPKVEDRIARRVTPTFTLTTILSSMLIGCLCARSLHYQFYTYIAWSTPFLLWRSGTNPVLIYVVWAAQEWAWNVFPSTNTSSMVVVGCLAIQVISVWLRTKEGNPEANPNKKHAD